MAESDKIYDILIIGGGVNGAGIARDAAGRGLSVMLVEKGDLASATSSASTKLFHGGLRYLEHYAFSLVRKALIEREVLLQNMPHIARPMRFVLPHLKGMRPAWLLRLGLFFYDNLGGRKLLPGTRVLNLKTDLAGMALKPTFRRAFEYSDGWVDDARLVVLNAVDAADKGAVIRTQTSVTSAKRQEGLWQVSLGAEVVKARALVNAAGPYVPDVGCTIKGVADPDPIRLVRGSHIVVPRLFTHDRAYFFQNPDGRIMFAIPYEEDFTLLGTTDVDHKGGLSDVRCSEEEIAYLCAAASEYFAETVKPETVVWTYAGVRPLDDAGDGKASAASRDYHLNLEGEESPLVSVYGGKITTYRKLSEQVMDLLAPTFPKAGKHWTIAAPLPGGDFPYDGRADLARSIQAAFPFLDTPQSRRFARLYGTEAFRMFAGTKDAAGLGAAFGSGLTALELRWLIRREFARTAEDVIWRRTKLGLRLSAQEIETLESWMENHVTEILAGD